MLSTVSHKDANFVRPTTVVFSLLLSSPSSDLLFLQSLYVVTRMD